MYLTNIFFTIYAFISGFNWRKIKHTVASFPYEMDAASQLWS